MVHKHKRWQINSALRPWETDEERDARPPRGPRIKRWIGAARRRESRNRAEEKTGGGTVITLTWAQTFGRPSANPRPSAHCETDTGPRAVILRPRR